MSRLFFSAICKACRKLSSSWASCEFAGVGADAVSCVRASNREGSGAAGSWKVAAGDCAAATHAEVHPTTMQPKACRAPEHPLKYRKKKLILGNSHPGRAPRS